MAAEGRSCRIAQTSSRSSAAAHAGQRLETLCSTFVHDGCAPGPRGQSGMPRIPKKIQDAASLHIEDRDGCAVDSLPIVRTALLNFYVRRRPQLVPILYRTYTTLLAWADAMSNPKSAAARAAALALSEPLPPTKAENRRSANSSAITTLVNRGRLKGDGQYARVQRNLAPKRLYIHAVDDGNSEPARLPRCTSRTYMYCMYVGHMHTILLEPKGDRSLIWDKVHPRPIYSANEPAAFLLHAGTKSMFHHAEGSQEIVPFPGTRIEN
ncbi:hypothetical protein CC78DRAFT_582906 [Lojkania enalia]|uniref:Uncharacterized protein n=1 Tax=Lojkania enalia TaxID=147567 RepID=A0A9P4K4Z9_9PLEO|nr:hypothetical protein CC78DRAFT_582906 [Didymosphaeria enalia]